MVARKRASGRALIVFTAITALAALTACQSRQNLFSAYTSTRACYRLDISAAGVQYLEGGGATWYSAASVCDAATPYPIATDVRVRVQMSATDGDYWYNCSYLKEVDSTSGNVAYRHGENQYTFGACYDRDYPYGTTDPHLLYRTSTYHSVRLPNGVIPYTSQTITEHA